MKRILFMTGIWTATAFAVQGMPIGEKVPASVKIEPLIKGSATSLEKERGKRHVLLLLWKLDCPPCKVMLPRLNGIEKRHQDKLAVVAVGMDHARMIRASGFADGLTYPVASGDKNFFEVLRRPDEMLPLAILIAPDGTLLWRGTPAAAEMAFREILAGKYDRKNAERNDRLNYEIQLAAKSQDYAGMVKIIDRELAKNPGQPDLLHAKALLLMDQLKKPAEALKTIDAGIALNPKKMPFHMLKLRLVAGNMAAERSVYQEIIRNFSDEPVVLLNLARRQMRQNAAEMNLEALYDLVKSAVDSPALPQTERALASELMARVYYFAGRPDLAVKFQSQALKYTVNALERSGIERHLRFYRQADALSKRIK